MGKAIIIGRSKVKGVVDDETVQNNTQNNIEAKIKFQTNQQKAIGLKRRWKSLTIDNWQIGAGMSSIYISSFPTSVAMLDPVWAMEPFHA